MDCHDARSSIPEYFAASTTYQNDYKPACEYRKEHYCYEKDKHELPGKPSRPYQPEDHESFFKLRADVHIPFDLLLFPKPIIQTNPYKTIKLVQDNDDPGKEESIKTRPRSYMTPAVSLDDIPEPEIRELLCYNMYTSVNRRAEIEATVNFRRVEPSIDDINSDKKVKYEVDHFKPLAEKFQRAGKAWDDPQVRGFVDPTREFWLHKDPPVVCGACVDPLKDIVREDTKQTIAALIKEEKLRMQHDHPPPTYTGYRMMLSRGLPLSKVDLPVVHPYLSTSQAITARYAEDLKK